MTHPQKSLGWVPHKPETWTARYGTLTHSVEMQHYTGEHGLGGPIMRTVDCPSGTRVKIVMVSRFGDIGITENLDAETGYGWRLYLDELTDLSMAREAPTDGER